MKAVYWITAGIICAAGLGIMGVGAAVAAGENSTKGENISRVIDSADSIDLDLEGISLDLEVSDSAKEITVDFTNVHGKADAELKNGTLTVYSKQKSRFFNLIDLKKESNVKIVVPAKNYEKVTLDLDAVYDSTISDLSTDRFNANFDAVTVTINNMTVSEGITNIDSDASVVKFTDCNFSTTEFVNDAGKLTVEYCDFTGSVKLGANASDVKLLNTKIPSLNVDSDASSIKSDGMELTGSMDVDLDAGSAKFGIIGDKSTFSVIAENEDSTVKVDGKKGNLFNSGSEHLINVKSSAASVEVNFRAPEKD